MKPMDAVDLLIRRIETRPDHRATIAGPEYRRWPDEVRALMDTEKLLVPAEAAEEIRCNDCVRRCFMPVERSPATPKRGAQTFIICDKDDGPGGSIDVDPRDLLRWQSHPELFAALLTRTLHASRAPKPNGNGSWTLGPIKIGKDRQNYTLGFHERRLALMTSAGFVRLGQILDLDGQGRLVVDRTLLKAEIGRNSKNGGYKPDTTRQESRKEETAAFYDELLTEGLAIRKANPHHSVNMVCQKLAKSPKNTRNANAETIRRKIGSQLG